MAWVTVESYSASYSLNQNAASATWLGQTFTPSVAHTILKVGLKLAKWGLPGIVTVSIRATDGDGKPTGSDLCSGTINGDTLVDEGGTEVAQWYEITLGSGYALSAGVKYAIVIRAVDASGGASVSWRYGTSSGYAGGQRTISADSGATWTLNNGDFNFYEQRKRRYCPP